MLTLVLIPGLVSDSRVWQPLADAAPTRGVHADVTRDASLSAMAERLLDEIDGELIPVGHSMGGRVALEMARLAPDRVRGLVLADTGHAAAREPELPRRQEMVALAHEDMTRFVEAWLPPMVHPDRTGDDSLMAPLREMVMQAGPDVHERQIRALVTRPHATAYLPQLRCPVLLLVGRQDEWSPVAQHQEIADLTPDAQMMVIEDAGHFAPVEQPAVVVAAISDWLRRQFGTSMS
ncbi:alpha/beta hydrolase [Microbacterium marinum]|uniref:alpha/beta fold hydrolase n=1 Tax=Microbacterium marinum TaxID=421115 RepID=UPI00384D10DC